MTADAPLRRPGAASRLGSSRGARRWRGIDVPAIALVPMAMATMTAAAAAPPPVIGALPGARSAVETGASPEEVDFRLGVLLDDGTDPDRRRQAAGLLAADPSEAARAAVHAALRSGADGAVVAMLEALEARPDLNAGLVDPLLDALVSGSTGHRVPISRLLARFGAPAAAATEALARDAARDVPARQAAIDALAVIATLECGHALLGIADPLAAPAAPEALRAAASTAFDRMVGRTFADDDARARWWTATSRRSNWWRDVLEHDRTRIADLEASIDALAARYVTLLRRVYADLGEATVSDDEVRLLLSHLEDPIRDVRRFAVGRIERRLRDGIAIPDPLPERVAGRLADDDAAVRTASIRVLDVLGRADLPDRLAARLDVEPDTEVVEASIETLGRRGGPEHAAPVVRRLAAADFEVAAARALAEIARRGPLPDAPRLEAIAILRDRLGMASSPGGSDETDASPDGTVVNGDHVNGSAAHGAADDVESASSSAAPAPAPVATSEPDLLRLLAAIGEPADAEALGTRLRPTEPDRVVTAIAEGLAIRGDLERLRAAAPESLAVTRVLVGALARRTPGADSARMLFELRPAEGSELRRPWEQAVDRIARGLSPDDLGAIDEELRTTSPEPDLRRRVLSAAFGAALAAARADTIDVAVNLIGVHLAGRDAIAARGVFERIDAANGTLPRGDGEAQTQLDALRFEVAVRTGHFDEASRVTGGDEAAPWTRWITLLERIVEELRADEEAGRLDATDVETANAIARTIKQRFGTRIPETERPRLNALGLSIPAVASPGDAEPEIDVRAPQSPPTDPPATSSTDDPPA